MHSIDSAPHARLSAGFAARSALRLLLAALLGVSSACGVEARDEGGAHRVFADTGGAAMGGTTSKKAAPVDATTYEWPAGDHPRATLEIEGIGAIVIELLPELAPKAVANFKKLASDGFFDGTTFHRVMPGFMIQGGDPNTGNDIPSDDGQGGPGYTLQDEFSDAPHLRGVVSMANKSAPNSSGSQFFIVHRDSQHLDGKYTVFGRVVEGIEAVDTIASVKTDTSGRWGPKDRPLENVTVKGVRIESGAAP